MEELVFDENEMMARLYKQASKENSDILGEEIRQSLLELLPNHYVGGREGLLDRICRRLGGHFAVDYRLGCAGWNGFSFYVNFEYYDYSFSIVKLQIRKLSEDMFITDADKREIVQKLFAKVEEYLSESRL